ADLARSRARPSGCTTYLGSGGSGGPAGRGGDAVAEGGAGFPRLGPPPRRERTPLAPRPPPDGGEGVGEGRARLAAPRGGAGAAVEARGERGRGREQPGQAGRGAGDRPTRPLAPRLDAEVVAGLAEGHLHAPAADEPARHL